MLKLNRINFRTKKQLQSDLEWCLNNYDNICISNKQEKNKYEEVIKYLLNTKGKNMPWSKEEIIMMIMFFSKDFAHKLEIDNKIEFEIRANDSDNPNVYGRCISKKSQPHLIVYYENLINLFMKKRKFPVLPLQIVFHEIVHAMHSQVVDKILPYEENKRYNLEIYMVTLENMLRKIDKNFYDANYDKLYKETNANKIGLYYSMAYLKKYMPKVYEKHDKTRINKTFKEYDIDYYNTYIKCLGSTESYFETMDALVIASIIKDKKILERYPVLKLEYKEDGIKKNIIELLEERKKLLENQDEKEINGLFEVLTNKKNYGENLRQKLKMEISLLIKYIEENQVQDKFIYELLNYRLSKLKEIENSEKQIFFDLKNEESYKKM